MAWQTLEQRLRELSARCSAAEKRAADAEDYAERTCAIYHRLYQDHAARLRALEGRPSPG